MAARKIASPVSNGLGQGETLSGDSRYFFRLYVTGAMPCSTRAVANLKRICEERLRGRYELEVVDLLQQPAVAADDRIVAAPTLVRLVPGPLRRFVGDLSNVEGILTGLELELEQAQQG